MKRLFKQTFLIFFLFASASTITYAQDQVSDVKPVNLSMDLVSRFVWRGVSLSQTPSIQPMLELKHKGFSLTAFGSYSIGIEKFQNTNLILSYNYKNVTVKLCDYFAPSDSVGAIHNYFNYSNKSTKHLYDAQLIIKGGERLPITFLFSTFIYGNDKKAGTTENNYSSYAELSYDFSKHGIDYSTYIGATLGEGFYGDRLGIANIGISAGKKIKLSDKLEIPVKMNISANPIKNNIYFVGIVSL